jgi:hypothetical protein
MFIAPSHPGRPAPLGAACKLNTKTHGAPPERWASKRFWSLSKSDGIADFIKSLREKGI